MSNGREYFIIEACLQSEDNGFVGYFQGIDKVTNSYQDKDGNIISSDKIDVLMTPQFGRARRFAYVFEAESWLRKLTSSDCDYRKYGIPYSFSIVFCRGEDKVVTWETKTTGEDR